MNNLFNSILSSKNQKIIIFPIFIIILASIFCSNCYAGDDKAGFGILEVVRATLSRQLNIRIQQKELEKNEGSLMYERGSFDGILEMSTGYNHEDTPLTSMESLAGIKKMETDTSSLNINYKKKYRSGMSISPIFQMTRTGRTGYDPQNNSSLFLLITIPLLKGSGIKAATANERAAEKNYEITMYNLYHKISECVLQTVLAYWRYVAARLHFDQLSDSLERAGVLVEETQILINADERPSSDLEQLIANLADRTASFISGKQALTEAKFNLDLAIGKNPEAFGNINAFKGDFSILNIDKTDKFIADELLIKDSLKKRFDYHASKQKEKYYQIQLEFAKNNILPQMDINFNLGYSGQDEGHKIKYFFSSLSHNIPGFSSSVEMSLNWPVTNILARGILFEKKATYDQSILISQEMERNIKTQVMIAISGIKNSKMEIKKAKESVKSYKIVADNEKIKFKLGISTLIDLISTEDRLTNALRNEISAYQKYAESLGRLRFETGTLIIVRENDVMINLQNLITIPEKI